MALFQDNVIISRASFSSTKEEACLEIRSREQDSGFGKVDGKSWISTLQPIMRISNTKREHPCIGMCTQPGLGWWELGGEEQRGSQSCHTAATPSCQHVSHTAYQGVDPWPPLQVNPWSLVLWLCCLRPQGVWGRSMNFSVHPCVWVLTQPLKSCVTSGNWRDLSVWVYAAVKQTNMVVGPTSDPRLKWWGWGKHWLLENTL